MLTSGGFWFDPDAMTIWPDKVDGLCFGGDYNPEQWPEATWRDDVRLMREAGVNLVTVGVFAWALLEREEGRYDFGWLDRVLDLLHEGGIRVDLATATAAPPPWFTRRYPQSQPVTREGQLLWPGSRQLYCPSSPEYRAAAVRLAEAIATRYGDHPALAMWHVNNEYGCHVPHCYCDVSAAAFRAWLRRRYGSLDALNQGWATTFWSQRYSDWAEITPPRLSPSYLNPTQQLDWWRFSSNELLDCYRAERAVLRRITPQVPVTTNFMAAQFKPVDYWAWVASGELDLVANDHYLREEEAPDSRVDLALAGDLTRSLADGGPWLLLEHSTSAVNWQPRNLAKLPGQLRRNSLQHVARGADGVMFFQWRASRGGAEKYHSGMVPHAGTDTKIWREVAQLGADLRRLGEVKGSRVAAEVAIVWDWEAWWALELDAHPSADLAYLDQIRAHHAALWRRGITADFVHPAADLSGYRAVLIPSLYLVSEDAAANLRRYADAGHLLVQCFSGIVDEHDQVRLGGYPGAFRDLLGIRVEEFFPLRAGQTVRLDDGSQGSLWSELVHLDANVDGAKAEVLATYADGPVTGGPALTRRGTAWYLSTCLAPDDLERLLGRICDAAGVPAASQTPNGRAPSGVEVVRRVTVEASGGNSYLFIINHNDRPATVPLPASGVELLSNVEVAGSIVVASGDVAILREAGA